MQIRNLARGKKGYFYTRYGTPDLRRPSAVDRDVNFKISVFLLYLLTSQGL